MSLLFNNGQSKVVDISKVLTDGKPIKKGGLVDQILTDDLVFNSATIIDNSIGWPGVGKHVNDLSGELVFHPYDIDPLVLYNAGKPDESQNLNLGKKIRATRKKLGLTQEELAKKVGTTKNYISKLENNKSDIELLTLKKIVEAGLNGKLHLSIELPS